MKPKFPITRKDFIDDLTVILAPSVMAAIVMLFWPEPILLAAFVIIQAVAFIGAAFYYRKVDIL